MDPGSFGSSNRSSPPSPRWPEPKGRKEASFRVIRRMTMLAAEVGFFERTACCWKITFSQGIQGVYISAMP